MGRARWHRVGHTASKGLAVPSTQCPKPKTSRDCAPPVARRHLAPPYPTTARRLRQGTQDIGSFQGPHRPSLSRLGEPSGTTISNSDISNSDISNSDISNSDISSRAEASAVSQSTAGDNASQGAARGNTAVTKAPLRTFGADHLGFEEVVGEEVVGEEVVGEDAVRDLRPSAPRHREPWAPTGETTNVGLHRRGVDAAGVTREARDAGREETASEFLTSPLRPTPGRAPKTVPGSAEAVASGPAAANMSPPETVVRVTIGTVVVRASSAQQPEIPRLGLASPKTSLAQYLERRGGDKS